MSSSNAPETLVKEIRTLIADKLLLEVSSPDEDLLSSGVLDSLTLIQLLVGLEQHFGIRIPLEEMQIDDVRSVRALAHLVESHKRRMPMETVHEASASPQGKVIAAS